MPEQKNRYSPLILAAEQHDYRWVPAVHEGTGEQVLLLHFPRKIDATWARQLNRIQQSIVPMGVMSLLPPHGYDFTANPAYYAVPALDFQPLDVSQLTKSAVPGSAGSHNEIDRLMLTLASAISRLHLDDLLIGTISPANVLLKAIPAPETAVLTALTDAIDLKMPLCGCQYNLRSEYAAPELLEFVYDISGVSSACMTPACDVFSLGMLYHELLTGRLPVVRRAESCPVPLEEPQISRQLDYPHRQLLRKMLCLKPEERLQSMSAVMQELNRILLSGDCYIDLHCPAQAGQTVLLRTLDVNCSRTTFSAQGEASFGPLLADQAYTLFCNRNRLGVVTFPDDSSGQHLYFDYDQLTESLLAAPPVTSVPTEADIAEAPLSEPERPVLPEAAPEIIPEAEPLPAAPAPEASGEAPPQPAEVISDSSDPVAQLMALLQHISDEQEEAAPAAAAEGEPAAAGTADGGPHPEEAPQESPPEPEPPAEPATPELPEEEEAPSRDRTRNVVIHNEKIMPNPPLNNISMIELLPQGYCRLTLINGGSFRIRVADAHRYGIAHLSGEE